MIKDKQAPEKVGRSLSNQEWTCQICSFMNTALLTSCQMCDSKRPDAPSKQIQKPKKQEKTQSGFMCHNCSTISKKLLNKCKKCGEVLIPEDSQEQKLPEKQVKSEKKKLVNCRNCAFENDPDNETCVSCERLLSDSSLFLSGDRSFIKPAPVAFGRGGASTIPCRYCGVYLKKKMMKNHERMCPSKGMSIEDYDKVIRTSCSFCYQKIDHDEVADHDKNCEKRVDFFSSESETYDRVTSLQRNTIIYMHNKCEKLHWINQESLIKKIKRLGFKENDLQNLHHYIVNYAPIIIHMHVNMHMQFFVKDTHYRNQFQTRKSSGSLSHSSRVNWEDRMFDQKHHSASDFQRVKYGTINFTNDPKGVRCCSGYGQSYFLLKNHVRNRCTVTDMDSSSASAAIGTFQFCYHILNKLSDAQLKAAFDGSKGNQIISSMIGTYKEIQIHGPVQFKKDVQRVYISKGQLTDPSFLAMTKQFCKNNDLEYEIFEHSIAGGAIFGGGGGFGSGGAIYDKKALSSQPRLIQSGKQVQIKPPQPLPAPVFGGSSIFGVGGKGFKAPRKKAVRKRRIFVPPPPVEYLEEEEQDYDDYPVDDYERYDEDEYDDDHDGDVGGYQPHEGIDYI